MATRAEMLADRDRHRARVHGGHVPDGERLLQRRHHGPGRGEIRPAVVLVVLLGLLLLAAIAHR